MNRIKARRLAAPNIQARRSPVALASRRMAFSLAIASTLLCSCVSLPITKTTGPGGAIIDVDPTGATFTDEGHALWLREGVPASFFTKTPQGWHISNLNYHAGNVLRLKEANP